ncbi:MAG: phage holin family protein [Candidatus Cardinium sp.]|uniref:phage holin family protein n=1 Tax=Candidatus Cardinium sp. TP TaxID=2961955 RepID=UPI0021AE33FA|nr:phage holin family protein [Candidatus Cardinium sp. TP]MCT4697147.1 phage holin family protein [Candidatus Cardinium sp. TP]MDN5247141.1 phage holin family protein [Candidatus Cardinium sp.]
MFVRVIKILCKLLGIACIVELVREKLGGFVHTLQRGLKAKAKKVAQLVLLAALTFILFGLGLRFLLLGLAYWLNALLSSTYLGFFLVSIFCFLMVVLVVLILRSKMNNQPLTQEKISDGT